LFCQVYYSRNGTTVCKTLRGTRGEGGRSSGQWSVVRRRLRCVSSQHLQTALAARTNCRFLGSARNDTRWERKLAAGSWQLSVVSCQTLGFDTQAVNTCQQRWQRARTAGSSAPLGMTRAGKRKLAAGGCKLAAIKSRRFAIRYSPFAIRFSLFARKERKVKSELTADS